MYKLYLDSGPKMKKTMVHVPELAGCTARGATTQAAIEATPDAIRAYLRFITRHGERADPKASFKTNVAEHITTGQWPGNGAGFLAPDTAPLTTRDIGVLTKRLAGLHADLRTLTGSLTTKQLDAIPAKGRPIRRILSHICAEGAYLRGVTGASRIQRLVDKGQLDANDALDHLLALEIERLQAMPEDERSTVIMRGQSPWTARAAVRRMLEHGWEHYSEIAMRLGKGLEGKGLEGKAP